MCDEEETDNAGDVGDVGDEDNFCQEILLDQCELISSVKNNPALYAKSSKEYSGKGFNKDLVWQSVGSSLTKPLSGSEASKIFYKRFVNASAERDEKCWPL
ncbi:uncharacterized protein LOC105190110 [Harpegnathos saltator]|uniref:uncharacterized protein LOC105190110 n=1 Tax=Harpegnathos saltator TaxID=610380 RepID=UPI00058FD646|nr:uncharacterized protein LOC105190110 [Harpegnathos saltator]